MSATAQAVKEGTAAAVGKVAVIGGGTMGNGIAQVFATAGIEVALVDVKPEFVDRAMGAIRRSLDRVAKKQGWDDGRAAEIAGRIRGGTSIDAAKDCPVVIEAVSEKARTPTSRRTSSASSTRWRRRTRSSPPTPRASRSPRSRPPPGGQAR